MEKLEPQMDLEPVTHEAQAQVQWDRAQIQGRHPHPVEQLWLWPNLYSREAPPQKMHQGNNLMASVEATWDNTSWSISLVDHLCPLPCVPPGQFESLMLTSFSQFLCLPDELTF